MRILYSKELYSKEALLKAAYHFTDNYYIYLGVEGDSFFVDLVRKKALPLILVHSRINSKMRFLHK